MIELENGYQIAVDDMNHTLQKKYVSNEGKESVRTLGYYTGLASALEAYYKISVAQKLNMDTYTLKEAIQIMKSEKERVEKLIG